MSVSDFFYGSCAVFVLSRVINCDSEIFPDLRGCFVFLEMGIKVYWNVLISEM